MGQKKERQAKAAEKAAANAACEASLPHVAKDQRMDVDSNASASAAASATFGVIDASQNLTGAQKRQRNPVEVGLATEGHGGCIHSNYEGRNSRAESAASVWSYDARLNIKGECHATPAWCSVDRAAASERRPVTALPGASDRDPGDPDSGGTQAHQEAASSEELVLFAAPANKDKQPSIRLWCLNTAFTMG
eukprot:3359954-Amphidinium_carterae.1